MSSTLSNSEAYRPPSTHLCSLAANARGNRLDRVNSRRWFRVEHVDVLDGFVQLPVLEVAQPEPLVALENTCRNACRKCRCSSDGSSANGLMVTGAASSISTYRPWRSVS